MVAGKGEDANLWVELARYAHRHLAHDRRQAEREKAEYDEPKPRVSGAGDAARLARLRRQKKRGRGLSTTPPRLS